MVFAAGSDNKEFTFRHDWNSLISDDETLQVRYYSRKYFPPADDYVSWPCACCMTVMCCMIFIWLTRVWETSAGDSDSHRTDLFVIFRCAISMTLQKDWSWMCSFRTRLLKFLETRMKQKSSGSKTRMELAIHAGWLLSGLGFSTPAVFFPADPNLTGVANVNYSIQSDYHLFSVGVAVKWNLCNLYSTGLWVPNIPRELSGIEHAVVSYSIG